MMASIITSKAALTFALLAAAIATNVVVDATPAPTALAQAPDTLPTICAADGVRTSAVQRAACEVACAPAAHCETNPVGTCLSYAPCVILKETTAIAKTVTPVDSAEQLVTLNALLFILK